MPDTEKFALLHVLEVAWSKARAQGRGSVAERLNLLYVEVLQDKG